MFAKRCRVNFFSGLYYTVRCAQQQNASDCRVYAAAFILEWAANSVQADLDLRYDIRAMRPHLLQCLERQQVVPFPRLQHRSAKKKNVRVSE